MPPRPTDRKPHLPATVGLRTVALFEAGKGLLALLVGSWFILLLRRGMGPVPAQIVRVLGLPSRDRFAMLLLQLAPRVPSRTLALLALLCVA